MAPEPINGTAARLADLRQNVRDIFERLRVVDELNVRVKHVESDVSDCNDGIAAVREWVEKQIEDTRKADIEKRRLKTSEKIALIGAISLVLAAIVSAVASLAASGVF